MTGCKFAFDANEIEFAKGEAGILCGAIGALVGKNVRAVIFIQTFEARREIYGVAERRVAVTQCGAHVADAGDSGVEADADVEMRLAFGFPLFLQLADALHHVQRRFAGAVGVAGFFEGRAPEGHYRVADVFIERALAIENDAGHIGKIEIQECREILCVEFFGNGGEAADVAEHDA